MLDVGLHYVISFSIFGMRLRLQPIQVMTMHNEWSVLATVPSVNCAFMKNKFMLMYMLTGT
jgi:hypothetical protein